MDRRSFIQSLMAGAAVVMLPSLAKASETVYTFPMNTVADLTAWMNARFDCKISEPRAFLEHKVDDLPKLYGFSSNDIPDFDKDADVVRFTHSTIAYACEGNDPVEAEKELVQALHKKFLELPEGSVVLWRVKPAFDTQQVTEFGDTYLSWEEVQDASPEAKEKLANKPDNVELDIDTDYLKYVKRKYKLNKVRMRVSFPLAPSDYVQEIKTAEGGKVKRI